MQLSTTDLEQLAHCALVLVTSKKPRPATSAQPCETHAVALLPSVAAGAVVNVQPCVLRCGDAVTKKLFGALREDAVYFVTAAREVCRGGVACVSLTEQSTRLLLFVLPLFFFCALCLAWLESHFVLVQHRLCTVGRFVFARRPSIHGSPLCPVRLVTAARCSSSSSSSGDLRRSQHHGSMDSSGGHSNASTTRLCRWRHLLLSLCVG